MLRIVTDGAGDFPPDWLEVFDFQVIPINIHFGDKIYLQGVDLSDEDFYKIVDETGVIPKTAQPSPHQFIEFYRQIAKRGDTILSMHITGKLSGTYASAEMAARELEGEFKIIPFDSGNGSAGLAYMCREAREMERANFSLEKILERMDYIRRNIRIVLTLDSLDYARMSGRVQAIQAALASLLNVKPIIELQEGMLDIVGRVRTRSKSIVHILEKLRAQFADRLVNIAVVHARDLKVGEQLLERVRGLFNYRHIIMTDLSIAVAANLGPGTVGLVAYPVE
ncbi:MAG: DegV family protein [Chloroflexota bacterium]